MGRPYETSVAWQRADDLVVEVYRVTQAFPKSELYGLTSQMRRAAVSVAANIAEGAARQYMKEFLRFLHVADSSLCEVAYYIHLAQRLGFIDADTTGRLEGRRSDAGRPLYRLIRWVKGEIEKGVVLNAKVAEAPGLYAVDRQPGTGDR
jgi:four helix bundle protein